MSGARIETRMVGVRADSGRCAVCGKPIRLWRSDRRYCSVNCRVNAYGQRCRAAYRAAKIEAGSGKRWRPKARA